MLNIFYIILIQKIMKLNIEELGLIGISFTDMLGFYEEDEINSIVEEINEEGSYYDDWMDFNKNDGGDVDCTLMTGSFEIIDHINNMKICVTDPFVMIVKDAWYGENFDGEEVGYISFEALYDVEEPPALKGGEYEKKRLMNDEELAEFHELSENEDIMYDVKYQDFYFIRTSKYNMNEWLKNWLADDYGHNK